MWLRDDVFGSWEKIPLCSNEITEFYMQNNSTSSRSLPCSVTSGKHRLIACFQVRTVILIRVTPLYTHGSLMQSLEVNQGSLVFEHLTIYITAIQSLTLNSSKTQD